MQHTSTTVADRILVFFEHEYKGLFNTNDLFPVAHYASPS